MHVIATESRYAFAVEVSSSESPWALSEEQAALRRVTATMVAGGHPQERLFALVCDEVCRLLSVEYAVSWAGTSRRAHCWSLWLERDGRQSRARQSLAARGQEPWSRSSSRPPAPARIDDYKSASGLLGDASRDKGVRSAVAAPILVNGSLWGVVIVRRSSNRCPRTRRRDWPGFH